MISERIGILRKASGMNQGELAKKLNISSSAVGMYEQGRRMPNVDTLIAMAKVFGVSLDYLLTGLEYPYSKEFNPEKRTPIDCPCRNCYWKNYRKE